MDLSVRAHVKTVEAPAEHIRAPIPGFCELLPPAPGVAAITIRSFRAAQIKISMGTRTEDVQMWSLLCVCNRRALIGRRYTYMNSRVRPPQSCTVRSRTPKHKLECTPNLAYPRSGRSHPRAVQTLHRPLSNTLARLELSSMHHIPRRPKPGRKHRRERGRVATRTYQPRGNGKKHCPQRRT